MKILFDYHAFNLQKFGGISRLYTKLLEGLDQREIDFDIPIKYSENYYLNRSSLLHKVVNLESIKKSFFDTKLEKYSFRGKSKLLKLLRKLSRTENPVLYNQRLSIEAIKKGDFDIFHPTYYDTYYLPYIGNKKLVVTVYDMIHEIYPEFFMGTAGWWTMVNKYKSLERADHIITISQSTKDDLVDIFDLNPDRITPVLINSDLEDDGSIANISKSELEENYFMFVGNRADYKNFYMLIPALSEILIKNNTYLYCVGGGNFTSDDRELFKTYNVENRIKYFDGNNANLKIAYQNSLGLIYSSSYEGFGMPLLEAARNNCLNIMSDIPTSREIIGDAGVYFDHKDFKKLREIVSNRIQGAYGNLIPQAKILADRFSWDKMVNETINVYKSLS